jgi:hypothetical protein
MAVKSSTNQVVRNCPHVQKQPIATRCAVGIFLIFLFDHYPMPFSALELIQWVKEALYPGSKVKNAWSFTFTPVQLHGSFFRRRDNCTFDFTYSDGVFLDLIDKMCLYLLGALNQI